jgi:hypothetical protein
MTERIVSNHAVKSAALVERVRPGAPALTRALDAPQRWY